MLYIMSTYLWKNEFLIQESKIIEKARKYSETDKPDEKLDAEKEDLAKSDKILDKVKVHSSFMKIFEK